MLPLGAHIDRSHDQHVGMSVVKTTYEFRCYSIKVMEMRTGMIPKCKPQTLP